MKKRKFVKKLLSSGLAVSMAASLLPVSALAVTGSQVAADGTYTSSISVAEAYPDAATYQSEDEDDWEDYVVTVTLTVKDGVFSSISVDSSDTSGDSDSYFNKATTKSKGLVTLLEGTEATADNISSWDTVSGATCTSVAVQTAALNALADASEAVTVQVLSDGSFPTDVVLTEAAASASEVIASLPTSVTYYDEDGNAVAASISWSCASFSTDAEAVNTFTWSADTSALADYDTSAITTSGSITVTNPAAEEEEPQDDVVEDTDDDTTADDTENTAASSALSCYVNAMGGIDFGDGLLESVSVSANADGTYTITLDLTTSEVTIYTVTASTYISDTTFEGETTIPGYYDADGNLVAAEYTTAVTEDGVTYVDTITFTAEQADSYYLYLYVNSNIMGRQFGGIEEEYQSILTVDWSAVETDTEEDSQTEDTDDSDTEAPDDSTNPAEGDEDFDFTVIPEDGMGPGSSGNADTDMELPEDEDGDAEVPDTDDTDSDDTVEPETEDTDADDTVTPEVEDTDADDTVEPETEDTDADDTEVPETTEPEETESEESAEINGLAYNGNGWYLYKNSEVVNFTGLYKCDGSNNSIAGWYYVVNGKVDFSYSGLVYNDGTYGGENGWYYVSNAFVDFSYTGLVYYDGSTHAKGIAGWYYVKNAHVDFSYTGVAENSYGKWYVKNAYVRFGVSGLVRINGSLYIVKSGKVLY